MLTYTNSKKGLIAKWMVLSAMLMFSLGFVSQAYAEDSLAKDTILNPVEASMIVTDTGEKYSAEQYFAEMGIDTRKQGNVVQATKGLNDFDSSIYDKVNLPVEMFDEDTRSIIGADGRWRITGTTGWPYRAIVMLRMTYPNTGSTQYGCTGWMIGARVLATAGHCVYDAGKGGWATSVQAWPGRNGSSTPYGTAFATNLYSVSGWTNSNNSNYDYGAVRLNSTLGNSTGTFGYRWQSSNSFSGYYGVTGYPCDQANGTMWRDTESPGITRTTSRRLFYVIDTFGCQSGSPVYKYTSSCGQCAVSIHTTGGSSENGSTRITKAVFNNLNAWRNR